MGTSRYLKARNRDVHCTRSSPTRPFMAWRASNTWRRRSCRRSTSQASPTGRARPLTEALRARSPLAREEGLLAGRASGAALWAAIEVAKTLTAASSSPSCPMAAAATSPSITSGGLMFQSSLEVPSRAVTIHIPTPCGCSPTRQASVERRGRHRRRGAGALTTRHPGLLKHLRDGEGKLRSFVNVYLGDEDIRYLRPRGHRGRGGRRDHHRAVHRRGCGVSALPELTNEEIARYSGT
jgi:molybdopterin synthase sulfur carrier subunit